MNLTILLGKCQTLKYPHLKPVFVDGGGWQTMADSQNPTLPAGFSAALKRIMVGKPAISADINHCGKAKNRHVYPT